MKITKKEEKIYRKVELYYRIQDAKNHVEDMHNMDDISDEQYKRLTEENYKEIAENFILNNDCNCSENSVFEEIIKNYIKGE